MTETAIETKEPVVETAVEQDVQPSVPDFEEFTGGLERQIEQPDEKPKAEPKASPKAGDETIVAQHDKQERHYVPLKKYVAMEKQFKAQRQYIEQLEPRITQRIQEAVSNALQTKHEPAKAVPNKEEDPQGWLVHQEEQRIQRDQQAATERTVTEQRTREREELLDYAKTHAEAWQADHPDYPDRLKLLTERFYENAIESGYTMEDAKRQGGELAYDVIAFSKKHSLNPAMFYHALADVIAVNGSGDVGGNMEDELAIVTPKKPNERLTTIAAGQAASKTLGGTGGSTGSKTGLTFSDLENMENTDEKFAKMKSLIDKTRGITTFR